MRWNIDASHSTAEFSVRHLMITNVKGRFSKLTGSADFDPAHPDGGSFEATIDAASVDTRDEKRDAHLKSADFFDVEKFPTIAFKSKKVAKNDDGYAATGDLTIHGVTKEVTLEIEELSKVSKDPWGNTRVGASAHTKINRKDFGLGWNQALETGGVLVGEQVKISLEVSMVQAG
jgi:polyisoprenoid-binding protein YceI